jgi:O-acetyl-ADP-ribose deacetylase
LRNATLNSLRLADSEAIHTISFPAISTGIFGYPLERCARIMLESVHQYCEGKTKLEEIRFCLFDESAKQVFESAAKDIFDRQ